MYSQRPPRPDDRMRAVTFGTAEGPRQFAINIDALGFSRDYNPSEAEVIEVFEKWYNANARITDVSQVPRDRMSLGSLAPITVDGAEDFMDVDAPEHPDEDPTANSPDPMDMMTDPHVDAIDVCCRIIRGMELAMQPWLPADCGESTLKWDQMAEDHRDEYRQLVLDVMADDYDHESPQPLSPELLRTRMATVLLNF